MQLSLPLTFVTGLVAAGVALAAPAPAPDSIMTIPVTKRNARLVDANGNADFKAIGQHLKALKAKYSQNAKNMAANESGKTKRAGTANIALTEQQDGSFWTGNVKFGGQTVAVDFDTGSADVILNKSAYTPGSTAMSTGKSFDNKYGTASNPTEAKGTIYADTFAAGSVTANKVALGHITSGSDIVSGAGGLAGLSYPALSSFGSSYPPFFDTLMKNGALSSDEFGLYLGETGSAELTLGGLDSSKYSGGLTWVDVSREAYWEVPASANGVELSSITDSGTTLIVADTGSGQAQDFFDAVGVQAQTDSSGAMYASVDCDNPPTITFTYGGKKVQLTKEAAVYAGNSDGSCILSVIGDDISGSTGSAAWIVGDPVFLSSYVAFSREKNAVGFATRA